MGPAKRRSIPHNSRRSLPSIVLHQSQPLDCVSLNLHIFWDMDDFRSLRVPPSKRIRSAQIHDTCLGSNHRRSRPALVHWGSFSGTTSLGAGCNRHNGGNSRCRLQFHAGQAQQSTGFNVLASVRRQGPVRPESLRKCPVGI